MLKQALDWLMDKLGYEPKGSQVWPAPKAPAVKRTRKPAVKKTTRSKK